MKDPLPLGQLLWPADQLSAALIAAAAAAVAGEAFGPEIDPVEIDWLDLRRALPRLAPAVLHLVDACGGHRGHLVVLPGRRRGLTVLAPDGRRRRLAAGRLAAALRGAAERRHAAALDPLLAALPLPSHRRRRACRALLAAHLAASPGLKLSLLSTSAAVSVAGAPSIASAASAASSGAAGPEASSAADSASAAGAGAAAADTAGVGAMACVAAGMGRPAIGLFLAVGTGQALALLAWYLLGRGLLAGRLDRGWLLAWALLLQTLSLARAAELAAGAALGHRAALLLRRRLFAALLGLAPGSLRGEGTGRLLGRLLGVEAFERGLLAGAPAALVAAAEIAGGAAALAAGAAATPHLLLLALALAATARLFVSHGRAHGACAASNRDLAGRLVEALAGHRTRLAQGTARGDQREDGSFAAHHLLASRLGASETLLRTALPRGWQLAALAALAPALGSSPASPGRLAASLGGLLLAEAGLDRLAAALCDLAAARTAAREVLPLLGEGMPGAGQACGGGATRRRPAGNAASGEKIDGFPGLPYTPRLCDDLGLPRAPRLLEARGLRYGVPGRASPILASASLEVRAGDRLLLDGPSGAGKSSLAAIFAARTAADSGLLLLDGLDLPTLGTRAWRRRVVAVPQLHANHLFAGSLAWNLLLGRAWPPSAGDLAAAAAVCRELGLGPLLDRLPAGLEQPIGEAGWQLSDGEASRVCVARALLQRPDLLILDESLAALDPESRVQVLAAACRRATTLLLISHLEPAPGEPGQNGADRA
jgi:ATP-binding cassette subfamily B protein